MGKTFRKLYEQVTSFENLWEAYRWLAHARFANAHGVVREVLRDVRF